MADFKTFITSEKFKQGLNLGKGLAGTVLEQVAAQQQVSGIGEAQAAIKTATNFNIGVDRVNTKRRVAELGRQTARILSTQRSVAISSNIGSTSKTALAFQHEALSNFEREVTQEIVSQSHRDQAAIFEADSQTTALAAGKRQVRTRQVSSGIDSILGIASQVSTILG